MKFIPPKFRMHFCLPILATCTVHRNLQHYCPSNIRWHVYITKFLVLIS
jgi:hypothetical protein